MFEQIKAKNGEEYKSIYKYSVRYFIAFYGNKHVGKKEKNSERYLSYVACDDIACLHYIMYRAF